MMPFKLKNPYFEPVLLLAANGLVLIGPFPALRYAGALVLLAFLPGWVWIQALLTQPRDIAERVTLAIGFSLALTIVGTMLVVYLPGPLTAGQLLMMADGLIGLGLIVFWKQRHSRPAAAGINANSPSPFSSLLHHPLFILLLLLLLAAALRLPHLGYAEFHEDEAEAMMLGTRLLQGEDYALFLHRKGPAQMLAPVAFWLLTGQINEGLARLPFALSSIFSTATLFFIGRRWFNWRAGAIAALLWAINGYAIGFGRMVQYQALIFFLGPLARYCLYLARQDDQPRLYFPAAILLATCLLAHFDALLLLPAAAYLWVKRRKDAKRGGRMKFSLQPSALILFLALLAVFYVPYFLDPEFQNTLTYLSGSRVKPGLLYNNLTLLGRLDKEYSSLFFLPVVVLGLVSLAVRQSLKVNAKWRWLMALMGMAAISSWGWPTLWQIDSFSLAIVPWLLLGALLAWSASTLADRAAWLMAGAAFIGYVFLVDDPRTHLYIIYPGAMLLSGAGWVIFIKGVLSIIRHKPYAIHSIPPTLIIVVLLLFAISVTYETTIFLSTESTLTQLRQRWAGSAWQTIYDRLPKARDYFGYPKREGWKAIGALRAQGQFPGDFRSVGEDFVIPIWYNYGQARSCYDTPAQFFVRAAGNDLPGHTSYAETGQVQREDEVRLRIFSASTGDVPPVPPIYTLEAWEPAFDQRATPAHFAQQTAPPQPREVQFGPAIKFLGYNLPITTITAGETLSIDLYWQALNHPPSNYRAFVHLTDGANLWGQQDDDPACRLPTSVWRVGQRSLGQFRLSIKPDTPPGRYPLIIGLYQADTLARLKITGGGQLGDDFLWLQDIEVLKR